MARLWRRGGLIALLLAVIAVAAAPGPAVAIEFENSKFRRAGPHAAAMVRAWQVGRASAKASGFFLANKERRLLVMTAAHVVGERPVFSYRGLRHTRARRLFRDKDTVIFEVSFGPSVRYERVGKLHIAGAAPRFGEGLTVIGYPKGFSGALMESGNCELLPRARLLHPSFFSCADLERWCDYAVKAGKSRSTCLKDADAVRRGKPRQCTLPLAQRATRHLRHAQSTHAMNCAVRLGSSGGPVILGNARRSRAVVGMPSAVFARVYGPFPRDLGVGVSLFSQGFKARARRLGITVR